MGQDMDHARKVCIDGAATDQPIILWECHGSQGNQLWKYHVSVKGVLRKFHITLQ